VFSSMALCAMRASVTDNNLNQPRTYTFINAAESLNAGLGSLSSVLISHTQLTGILDNKFVFVEILYSELTFIYIYIKMPHMCVCVSVFQISQKRADRFPRNFSWYIGVIGRRQRIKKHQENLDP